MENPQEQNPQEQNSKEQNPQGQTTQQTSTSDDDLNFDDLELEETQEATPATKPVEKPSKDLDITALEKMGIEAKTKNLQIFSGGAKKADWDVGLAVDAIKLAPKLDAIILVTGDGDFVPLVEYLQVNEGCQVEVMSFGRSSSSKLIESCDDFIDLDKNPRKYLIGYREMRMRRERPTENTGE
jgi:uncharacterized LabA/DUF88 family protein